MSEQNEGVTVRRLPGGETHFGRLESCTGRRLRFQIPQLANSTEFTAGTLVEVQSDQILYLGVVVGTVVGVVPGRQHTSILVAIEHTVDRMALATIQEVWHASPGD